MTRGTRHDALYTLNVDIYQNLKIKHIASLGGFFKNTYITIRVHTTNEVKYEVQFLALACSSQYKKYKHFIQWTFKIYHLNFLN